ncbi:MAG: GerMN domain-containing protein [Deltaproteobacteria bacterium]|jgi:spore germination protein GerM|nr:GerMN domain-containing protein [Deltaproteobacteria bacterium]MBW2477200.1 GerMN domain-containing protein [Deltaproteobacteria bacterium]
MSVTSNSNPKKMSKRLLDRRLVFGAFVIILVIFGALFFRKYQQTTVPPEPLQTVAEEPRQLREVILYFASNDGTHLVAEGREIEDCLVEEDCLQATVQALLDGPVGDLTPILPSHAVLNSLAVSENLVSVDFNGGLISGHPGGTQSELLTVYGLADTLAANFPHLRQVRFLVDGKPIETIKGHVDLRQPITADFSLVEEGAAPTGDMSKLGQGADQ